MRAHLHPSIRVGVLLALLAGMLFGPAALQASAQVDPVDVTVTAQLKSSGALEVTQTLDFGTADAPADLSTQLMTRQDTVGTARYNYTISDIRITSGGTEITPVLDQQATLLVVSLPSGAQTSSDLQLSYTVTGATHREPNGSVTFTWPLVQGWSVPINEATGTVATEGDARDFRCEAGPAAALRTCSMYAGGTPASPNFTFSDGPRQPGELIVAEMSFDASGGVAVNEYITHRWTLDRALGRSWANLLAALAALALGGLLLYALHRVAGRDEVGTVEPTQIAEFRPVGDGQAEFVPLHDIRPGQVGTLADETVDPVDITATILDLATRGYLLITELPRTGAHDPFDWTLQRRDADLSALRPYERTILDAVAPADGSTVQVSRIENNLGGVVAQVQDELYADVVQQGWFSRRPDQTRSTWRTAGWIALGLAVVAFVLLAIFTTFGLTGLVLIGLAAGLVLISTEMPARTQSGSSVLAGLQLLAGQLQMLPTDRAPKGRELAELSEVLPYAVVLGGTDRWLEAISASDDDAAPDSTDLAWYHGDADWQLADLPASIRGFVTTVQGRLFAR